MYQEIDADKNAKLFRSIWEVAMDRLCQGDLSPEVKGALKEIARLCDEAGIHRFAIRATDHDGEIWWLTDDDSGDEGRGFSPFHAQHLVTFITRDEAQSRIAWMTHGRTSDRKLQLAVVPVSEMHSMDKAAE